VRIEHRHEEVAAYNEKVMSPQCDIRADSIALHELLVREGYTSCTGPMNAGNNWMETQPGQQFKKGIRACQ